jgi:GAF domain-containing protein
MSEIFESMHDIHFMKDALDGADFVLELLREKIPTALALVHFYDINAKEFVVVKGRAPNGTSVSGKTREGTGLVGAALVTGKPIMVKNAASDERWSRETYTQGGHTPREIVVVPMRHHGRFLGALELSDHLDGGSFGDTEVHAMSYVAEQFAEFVQDRGVLISRGADSTGSFQVIEPQRRR